LIKTVGVLVLIGLAIGAPAPGRAQDERQAKEIIDAYKVWKLTDVLDLSEDEMPVFFSRVRKIGEAEDRHRRAEREAVKEIDELLKAGADDAELAGALRRYEDMRRAHWEETQRLREQAASMLTLRQRCKYAVFEERFRAEIRKMISDVRSGRDARDGTRVLPPQGEGKRQGGSGRGRR